MSIFFRKTSLPPLTVAMAGVRMGNSFLQVGCGNGTLLAALAGIAGLSGRACCVDEDPGAVERARSASEKAGVLVEVKRVSLSTLPYEQDAFDVVVINQVLPVLTPEARVACLRETARVLRPAGRCMVIDPVPRGGLGGLFTRHSTNPQYETMGGPTAALRAEGFVAVRKLAERDGLRFVEAAKPA